MNNLKKEILEDLKSRFNEVAKDWHEMELSIDKSKTLSADILLKKKMSVEAIASLSKSIIKGSSISSDETSLTREEMNSITLLLKDQYNYAKERKGSAGAEMLGNVSEVLFSIYERDSLKFADKPITNTAIKYLQ